MKAFVVKAPFAPLIALGIKTIETKPGPPAGDMKPEGVRPASGCAINRGERVAIVIGKTSYSYDEYPEAWDVLAEALGSAWNRERWPGYPQFLATCFKRGHMDDYPLGSIICTAIVGDALPIVGEDGDLTEVDPPCVEHRPTGATNAGLWLWPAPDDIEGIDDLTLPFDITDQIPLGEYTPGRCGWMLQDVQACDPIPCGRAQGVKNHQGVFRLPPAITAQLGEAQ